MTLRMVCGYRRSGKDTLFMQIRDIQNGTKSTIPFNWVIYRNTECQRTFLTKDESAISRIAFADAVKTTVKETHTNLPPNVDDIKDQPLDVIDGKTFRQLCIKVGLEGRHRDPDLWCRNALKSLDRNCNYIVTDWRFRNEYTYACHEFDVISVRVFRRSVELPPKDELSENDLNTAITDFVLIPSEEEQEEWRALINLFPFYHNYARYQMNY